MANARIPATGTVVLSAGTLGIGSERSTLYVNRVASDGWLQALDDATKQRIPLSKYTKVAAAKAELGRVKFRVEDGPQRGRALSLSEANASEYLGLKPPTQQLARVTVSYGKYVERWLSVARGGQELSQQMATLSIGSLVVQVTMNSVWNGLFTPLEPGEYKVLLPDTPHRADMTRFYRNTEPRLQYDQVWFPIQHGDNSRYIHVGNVSDGCATVLDLARWAQVHEALISHRGPDGRSVATMSVLGKPARSR